MAGLTRCIEASCVLSMCHSVFLRVAMCAVAYPGFNQGGGLTICVQSTRENLETTPTFVDHTHHFRLLLGVHY